MNGFRFDCEFCEEVLEAKSSDTVESLVGTHVSDDHADQFKQELAGKNCFSMCGHVFSENSMDVPGFDCPNCEQDNFGPLVEQYVFWRMEKK